MTRLTNDLSSINLDEARTLTYRWQKKYPILKAFLFHRNEIETITKKSGTVGARFYMGLNQNTDSGNAEAEMLVVGVDEAQLDIINTGDGPSLVDNFALPCPFVCSENPALLLPQTEPKLPLQRLLKNRPTPIKDGIRELLNVDVNDGDMIELTLAEEWTGNWHNTYPEAPWAVYFSKETIEALFYEDGEEYIDTIRIYFGLDETEKVHLVMVGVDGNNNDITDGPLYTNSTAPCHANCIGNCDCTSCLYLS